MPRIERSRKGAIEEKFRTNISVDKRRQSTVNPKHCSAQAASGSPWRGGSVLWTIFKSFRSI
jgi:hypothetical protein